MKNKILSVLLLSLFSINVNAQTKSINEEHFISIGGIEQWVTISGDDSSKPMLLFIHGGPGSTMSQYENSEYQLWKKDFILVHWDQRGAGRTYGKNVPENATEDYWIENPLNVEQITNDGIELSEYLIKHFQKKKIILLGTSWGSIIGAKMALSRPDLFSAYIGHSQIVNPAKGFIHAYNEVFEMAQKAKDQESLDKLKSLGAPPYDDAKKEGQLMRIIKKYEKENSNPAPENWWKLATAYDNEKDAENRYDGDDYSFLYFAGFKKMGIKSMVTDIDFMKDGLDYKIPVYFIQGEADILTSRELTKTYFDSIKAPKKKYILLPDAAHGHNQSVIDTQYKIVKNL